ncbi:MAG TPA: hypothetical protein VHC19_00065, partial [Pirellulales bacterium]|nr:hypothetical protein [Pirellulales bacterium]
SGAGNRYELGWDGPGDRFLDALRAAGAEVSHLADSRALATVPSAWNTTRLFRLAADSGVAIKHLKPDEENLERFFFRVTSEGGTHNTECRANGERCETPTAGGQDASDGAQQAQRDV